MSERSYDEIRAELDRIEARVEELRAEVEDLHGMERSDV